MLQLFHLFKKKNVTNIKLSKWITSFFLFISWKEEDLFPFALHTFALILNEIQFVQHVIKEIVFFFNRTRMNSFWMSNRWAQQFIFYTHTQYLHDNYTSFLPLLHYNNHNHLCVVFSLFFLYFCQHPAKLEKTKLEHCIY